MLKKWCLPAKKMIPNLSGVFSRLFKSFKFSVITADIISPCLTFFIVLRMQNIKRIIRSRNKTDEITGTSLIHLKRFKNIFRCVLIVYFGINMPDCFPEEEIDKRNMGNRPIYNVNESFQKSRILVWIQICTVTQLTDHQKVIKQRWGHARPGALLTWGCKYSVQFYDPWTLVCPHHGAEGFEMLLLQHSNYTVKAQTETSDLWPPQRPQLHVLHCRDQQTAHTGQSVWLYLEKCDYFCGYNLKN